jgi:hypothetical protein
MAVVFAVYTAPELQLAVERGKVARRLAVICVFSPKPTAECDERGS